jgi:hypothetical protein
MPGDDLWLFSKATNITGRMERLSVLLTPGFDGSVRYEKMGTVLRIIATPATAPAAGSVEVSYRLTAPRFDDARWTNYNDNPDAIGLKPEG